MRALIATVLISALLSSAAFAQVMPASKDAVPVAAGKTVFGIIVYPSGMYTVGNVKVVDSTEDDMFSYWEGTFDGNYYYYDPYSMRWMPGPVTYTRSTLAFQDQQVEGWVRNFGGLIDYNHFYGNDGDLYKRVNIYKRNAQKKQIRGRLIYSFYRDVRTGERSDSGNIPFVRITGADVQFVNDESRRQEEAIQTLVDATPDLGEWQDTAKTLPTEVAATNELPKEQDPSLAQIIQSDISPLFIGPQKPAAK